METPAAPCSIWQMVMTNEPKDQIFPDWTNMIFDPDQDLFLKLHIIINYNLAPKLSPNTTVQKLFEVLEHIKETYQLSGSV